MLKFEKNSWFFKIKIESINRGEFLSLRITRKSIFSMKLKAEDEVMGKENMK